MSEPIIPTIEVEVKIEGSMVEYRPKGSAMWEFASRKSHIDIAARELLKPKVPEFKRDLAVTFARIVWPWTSGEPDHRDWMSLCVHKDRADRALELAEASIASTVKELKKQVKLCQCATEDCNRCVPEHDRISELEAAGGGA